MKTRLGIVQYKLLTIPVSPTTLLNIALEEWSHGLADESMKRLIRGAIGEIDEPQLAVDGFISLDNCTTFDAYKCCDSGRREVHLRKKYLD